MKEILTKLQKVFDHRVRLGIMSILIVSEWVDFTQLRETLQVTDGALASHLKPLEEAGYVEVRKSFVGRKPNTSFQITELGKTAFNNHLDALEQLIRLRDPKSDL